MHHPESPVREPSANIADRISTPHQIEWFRGFRPMSWVEGTRLSRENLFDPAVLNEVGQHLGAVSGPPMSQEEQTAAIARLEHMLFWNIKAALGDNLAERALRTARNVQTLGPCRTYRDGRLEPHEWIRTDSGAIFKLHSPGREVDHTVVGRQPIHWDLAAATVEARLTDVSTLLGAMRLDGSVFRPAALDFFCLAYAAFRMGQASLCADVCANDTAECERACRAFSMYRADLRKRLHARG